MFIPWAEKSAHICFTINRTYFKKMYYFQTIFIILHKIKASKIKFFKCLGWHLLDIIHPSYFSKFNTARGLQVFRTCPNHLSYWLKSQHKSSVAGITIHLVVKVSCPWHEALVLLCHTPFVLLIAFFLPSFKILIYMIIYLTDVPTFLSY